MTSSIVSARSSKRRGRKGDDRPACAHHGEFGCDVGPVPFVATRDGGNTPFAVASGGGCRARGAGRRESRAAVRDNSSPDAADDGVNVLLRHGDRALAAAKRRRRPEPGGAVGGWI